MSELTAERLAAIEAVLGGNVWPIELLRANSYTLLVEVARLKAELEQARQQLAAVRRFAEGMRGYCSPHGVSLHYADQLDAVLAAVPAAPVPAPADERPPLPKRERQRCDACGKPNCKRTCGPYACSEQSPQGAFGSLSWCEKTEGHGGDHREGGYSWPQDAVLRCRAEYKRPEGRQIGDRLVACHLPAGHPGEHEEADTEITWLPDAVADTAEPRATVAEQGAPCGYAHPDLAGVHCTRPDEHGASGSRIHSAGSRAWFDHDHTRPATPVAVETEQGARCGQWRQLTPTSLPFVCKQPNGHSDEHNSGLLGLRWPNETAAAPVVVEPADVQQGGA